MKIFVCIKNVPDTAANIKVLGGNSFDESVKFIINPYDEYAIEEATRLVEKQGGEVVLISIGKASAMTTVRAALALGPNRAILVTTDRQFLDSDDTASILQKVMTDDGPADLIFTGKQAVDSEAMQTSYRLAAKLEVPIASEVRNFSIDSGKVVVEREIGGGEKEVIEMSIPCIVAATKGLNEPRYPKLPDVMKAKKKDVKQISLADLGLELKNATELVALEAVPERAGAKVIGGSVKEAVAELVRILREEEKVLG
jgi:electron transfer flavoprotein beta subunit